MMGVLETNIDQLPKIAFSAMLVHIASKKSKNVPRGRAQAAILDLHGHDTYFIPPLPSATPSIMTTDSALGGGSIPVGLIIAIPVFLAVNALLAVVGARWMNRLSHDSSEDVLTAHYLGGRSFGPWLTLGTTFATMFSGFTIIGIPNDAVRASLIHILLLSSYF